MIDKNIKLSIIIVDDSHEDHFFIKMALHEYKNIHYNDYFNGEDFLNFIEQKSKASQIGNHFPDIVILDVNMPKLSGFEVFDIVEKKGLKNQMRFFILTTSLTERENKHCGKFGLNCYQKPFSVDEFSEVLEK